MTSQGALKQLLVGSALLWVGATIARGGPAGTQEEPVVPDAPRGAIIGRVEIGADANLPDNARVLLMSASWSEFWSGAVQQKLDFYANRYRAELSRNPESFREITGWAYRDAAGMVIGRMQAELGPQFSDWVTTVSSDGRFEFQEVPFGNYRVVAVASAGTRALIWDGAVRVSSGIPEFIELPNRVQ